MVETQATTSLDERGAGAVRVGNGNRELGALQMKAGARAVITANGSVEIAKLVSIRGGRLTGLGSGAGLGDLPGSCPRPQ